MRGKKQPLYAKRCKTVAKRCRIVYNVAERTVTTLTIFYLQLRDPSDTPSLNHLVTSLLGHFADGGATVNVIAYSGQGSGSRGQGSEVKGQGSDVSGQPPPPVAVPPSCANVVGSSGNIHTLHLKRRNPKKQNFALRYLYECWLIVRAALHSKLWKASDACLVYSFPSSFLYIWFAKVIFRKRVIYWIQDLWPENAAEIGVMKRGGASYRLFSAIEKRAYRRADALVPISEDMEQRLIGLGVDKSKLTVVHNWGYGDDAQDIPWDENKFAEMARLDKETFYAVYAGNIGAVQNVELIVEAASRLAGRADIRFLIVGDGVAVDAVKEMAKDLANVTFYPMQPPDMVHHVYSAASVNLIPLRKGVIHTALPSKTAVLLACGRPVIASVDADSRYAALLRDYGAAPVTDPEDPAALADAIAQMADTLDLDGAAENVRSCFEEQFSQKIAFERFDGIFREVLCSQTKHY
jgi:glycosyltransferase involved in cell wall biosynthesis